MRLFLVNLSNERFSYSRHELNATAESFGVDEIVSWSFEDLMQRPFFAKNADTLTQPRGAGYWLWKPYIILDLLERVENGDVVLYCDAATSLIRDIRPLVDVCLQNDGFLCIYQYHKNYVWTKRDAFVLMDCDSTEYHEGQQSVGGFMMYEKNDKTRAFVREWLDYCCDPRILTDMPNECGLPNYEGFKDHRHEQSVISLLITRWGIQRFPMICEYHKPHDPPFDVQYVDHHRRQGYSQYPENPAWKTYIW